MRQLCALAFAVALCLVSGCADRNLLQGAFEEARAGITSQVPESNHTDRFSREALSEGLP